ncbi:murein transglycosylase A [Futiania mangrovi]|uniref:peptidoglycan lytic exotransglycosylase n=1 Tax=Futiania mangrovi TaxID=2959716 RepID=A0A9J6PF80_9PROT|nr:MltA domain-containing protein [Futiania mangrovii]MCP1336488.1 MltA domain-containing protein [Futiania mangrovii]
MRRGRARIGFILGCLVGLAAGIAFVPALDLIGRLVTPQPEPPAPPPAMVLAPAGWADLPGWAADDHAAARVAVQRTCSRFSRLAGDAAAGPDPRLGRAGDWAAACAALAAADDPRAGFEDAFLPVHVFAGSAAEGLFTGYYEPQLTGSRTRGGPYQTPLLTRPADLVDVDLGAFRESLKGQRIAGRVEGNRLRPYPAREAIVDGALPAEDLALVWVDDPVAAFFLQIQGSGRVALEDGSVMRVGYAGQNGHPYTAIGRVLVAEGQIPREAVSLQSIRAWLAEHPDRAQEVMNANASYVFFREIEERDTDLGPPGATGVPLTPGRSLAVDRTHHAMGAPVFVATLLPQQPGAAEGPTAWQRLMVAQDTGGAIVGPVRGDIFFGFGEEAEWLAGHMQSQGRMWLLLPRPVAAGLATDGEAASGS